MDEFLEWLWRLVDEPIELDGPPMQETTPWSMPVSEDNFLKLPEGADKG